MLPRCEARRRSCRLAKTSEIGGDGDRRRRFSSTTYWPKMPCTAWPLITLHMRVRTVSEQVLKASHDVFGSRPLGLRPLEIESQGSLPCPGARGGPPGDHTSYLIAHKTPERDRPGVVLAALDVRK